MSQAFQRAVRHLFKQKHVHFLSHMVLGELYRHLHHPGVVVLLQVVTSETIPVVLKGVLL